MCTCHTASDKYKTIEAVFTVPKILAAVEAGGLTGQGNAVAFDEQAIIGAGVSQEDAEVIGNWIHQLNQLIKGEAVQLGAGPTGWQAITPRSPLIFATTFTKVIAGTTYSFDSSVHWYGTKLTLNKAATTKLAQLLGAGAAAGVLALQLATVVGVTIPADLPIGLLTAVATMGGAAIWVADMCMGVSFIQPWGGVPPVILIPNL
jgi:hypothetical protein